MTPEQFTEWREKLSLSKIEVAELLDILPATVEAYETGPDAIPRVVELACEALSHRKGWQPHKDFTRDGTIVGDAMPVDMSTVQVSDVEVIPVMAEGEYYNEQVFCTLSWRHPEGGEPCSSSFMAWMWKLAPWKVTQSTGRILADQRIRGVYSGRGSPSDQ